MGMLIEARDELILKNADHDLLPEGEENGDFDGQKLKECRVWCQRFVERVIEEDKIIQRVWRGDTNYPTNDARHEQISTVISWNIVLIMYFLMFVGINQVHE